MAMKLPGWVVDDITSVRREALPYRTMTPEERAARVRSACATVAKLLRARPDAAAALAFQDPLPESTRAILRRLRGEKVAR